jgi:hypothetical protein
LYKFLRTVVDEIIKKTIMKKVKGAGLIAPFFFLI